MWHSKILTYLCPFPFPGGFFFPNFSFVLIPMRKAFFYLLMTFDVLKVSRPAVQFHHGSFSNHEVPFLEEIPGRKGEGENIEFNLDSRRFG